MQSGARAWHIQMIRFLMIRIRTIRFVKLSECSVRKCCSWAAIPICDSRYWCRCLVEVWNCVHVDISSGSRIGKRARLGNARGDPSLWRADATSASPMQLRRAGATSIAGKDFLPAIALEEPVVGQGPWAFCKWRDDGIVPLIFPTCQNVFAGIAQGIHASDRHATLHGVVFDILVGSESLVLPELVMNRRSEPQNPHASSV